MTSEDFKKVKIGDYVLIKKGSYALKPLKNDVKCEVVGKITGELFVLIGLPYGAIITDPIITVYVLSPKLKGKTGMYFSPSEVKEHFPSSTSSSKESSNIPKGTNTSKEGRFLSGIDKYSRENYVRPEGSGLEWL
jgi:hypothetical protein